MPIVHALGEETPHHRSKMLENISGPDRVLILAGEPAEISTSHFRNALQRDCLFGAQERGIGHGIFYSSC